MAREFNKRLKEIKKHEEEMDRIWKENKARSDREEKRKCAKEEKIRNEIRSKHKEIVKKTVKIVKPLFGDINKEFFNGKLKFSVCGIDSISGDVEISMEEKHKLNNRNGVLHAIRGTGIRIVLNNNYHYSYDIGNTTYHGGDDTFDYIKLERAVDEGNNNRIEWDMLKQIPFNNGEAEGWRESLEEELISIFSLHGPSFFQWGRNIGSDFPK